MKRLNDLVEKLLISKGLVTEDLKITKILRSSVLEMSDAFTRNRDRLPADYFESEEFRCAYIAAFMLTNAKKVYHLLGRHRNLIPGGACLRVLDIGTGPGTALFAASSFLAQEQPDRKVKFIATDSSSRMLGEAKSLSKDILPKNHHVEWLVGDVRNLKKLLGNASFDLAMAANSLNEVPLHLRKRICTDALNVCGKMIVVDPALKRTSRELMSLRDQLLSESKIGVLSPCTHQQGCPMLKMNERDWCHFYIEWNRPRLIEMIDRATGLDHRHLKLSYLALSAEHPSDSKEKMGLWRVASSPLCSRGKSELVLCGDGTLKKVRRLDRNASPENEGFGRARRGDLVALENKDGPGEVRAHDKFKILESFL